MSKIQKCLVTFGAIVGIVGILHGSAELLHGSALVESHRTRALPENWPNLEFYSLMEGSPVFSLITGIPHYVLGLLAISISTVMIVVSVTVLGAGRGVSAWGLALFAAPSLGIFLFGAGEGTPVAICLPLLVFGVLSLVVPETRRSEASRRRMLWSFNVFYGLQIFSWVLFFPGLFVLSFYGEIPRALFLFDFFSMPVSILGAGICGLVYDTSVVESR